MTRTLFRKLLIIKAAFFFLSSTALPQTLQNNQRSNQDPSRIRIAQDYERRGNYLPALNIYSELFNAVPQNRLYYDGVKRNMIRLRRFDELVVLIENQIQGNNQVLYYADLGDVFYKKGAQEQAFQKWQEALEKFGTQKQAYTYLANAMVVNRLYDEAIEIYLTGREKFEQENLFVFELANIYVMRLKYKEATVEYLKHLANHPNQFGYIESRIVNYTKDPEQARQVAAILSENISGHKQQFLVRKLLADLYLRIENYALAFEQFRQLERMPSPSPQNKLSRGRELFFFAEKALGADEYAYAEASYNLILTNYPNSSYRVRAMYGLAVSKQKQGFVEDALTQFRRIVKSKQKSPWIQWAQFEIGEIFYLDKLAVDSALVAYQKLIRHYPAGNKIHKAYFRMGDCYAAKADVENAMTWYNRALNLIGENAPSYDEGRFRIAYLQFVEGNYDEALEQLNEITARMGRANVDQDFVNDALELIFLIEENRKGRSEESLRLYSSAEKKRLANDTENAIELLQQIVTEYPTSSVLDETLNKLGELENARGNHLIAINHFEKVVSEHGDGPYAALAQKRIAEIYEVALYDFPKAYEAYEKVLVEHPTSIYLEEVRHKLRELHTKRLNN